MILAGLFAFFLVVAMILADWLQFSRLTSGASTYGCGIGRGEDHLPIAPWTRLIDRFDQHGVLRLEHGMAKCFHQDRRILLRARAHRFRTAWPINGSIEITPGEQGTRLTWVKRVPWSSAVLTSLWFVLVTGGTLAFAIVMALTGGFASLGGALMAAGIIGLGLLVLAFGLVTVSLAYRLENHRLLEAYQELRAAFLESAGSTPGR